MAIVASKHTTKQPMRGNSSLRSNGCGTRGVEAARVVALGCPPGGGGVDGCSGDGSAAASSTAGGCTLGRFAEVASEWSVCGTTGSAPFAPSSGDVTMLPLGLNTNGHLLLRECCLLPLNASQPLIQPRVIQQNIFDPLLHTRRVERLRAHSCMRIERPHDRVRQSGGQIG